MKVIIEQNKFISLAIGNQKIIDDKEYRLLHFSMIANYDDKTLLYNNLTKELLSLEKCEDSFLDQFPIKANNDIIKKLIKKWFLVPIEHNDCKLSDQITQISKQFSDSKHITLFNILPTTGCNARCFYCFEAGTRSINMSSQTAASVADYILEKSGNKKVEIRWFGGEPLCNVNAINIISERLFNNKINYISNIVTNGYLFNDNLILQAKKIWNLKKVQITLDGMSETYNTVKNYINDDPNPFNRVIENIGKLLKANINVSIRLNMDLYNESELYKLVDYLYKLYGKNEFLSVYACPLFEDVGYKPINHSVNEKITISERFLKLYQYIQEIGLGGYTILKNDIKANCCMADSMNAVLISPEGKLGRCEHYVDDDFYGSIFTDEPRQPWTKYKENLPECETCVSYPTCFRLEGCATENCADFNRKWLSNNLKKSIIYTYNTLSKNV